MKSLLIVLVTMASFSAMASEGRISQAECLKRVEAIVSEVEKLGDEVFKTPSNFSSFSYRAGLDNGLNVGTTTSVEAILKDICVKGLN
jgi:hypothetical protein